MRRLSSDIVLTHCSPANSCLVLVRAGHFVSSTLAKYEIAGGGLHCEHPSPSIAQILKLHFAIKHARQLTRVGIPHYPRAFRYCITCLELARDSSGSSRKRGRGRRDRVHRDARRISAEGGKVGRSAPKRGVFSSRARRLPSFSLSLATSRDRSRH